MAMQATRMLRAGDWSDDLRSACDRYEAAADLLVNAMTAEEGDAARPIYRKAREAFEAKMLAHIKSRRVSENQNYNGQRSHT